ncbi:hypothetical protein WH390_14850 (plasmid) [Candidatus Arsenophonus nilaparvatae]
MMTVLPAIPVAVQVRYTNASRWQGSSDNHRRALRSPSPITARCLTKGVS